MSACLSVCLFQDDDLEEGEVKDPSDRKVRPRPTCRFFMKGNGVLWCWKQNQRCWRFFSFGFAAAKLLSTR